MSREYKLSKSELTRLKRQDKLFGQFLPVLRLKQEQLQQEQNRISRALAEVSAGHAELLAQLQPYLPCFADNSSPSLDEVISIFEIKTADKAIAGMSFKELVSVSFCNKELPWAETAPWLLPALPVIKSYLAKEVALRFLEKENLIIRRELKKATQKVNLFEMVLMPKTTSAIKHIEIFLGDEQVAAVSRGKIAKGKRLSPIVEPLSAISL